MINVLSLTGVGLASLGSATRPPRPDDGLAEVPRAILFHAEATSRRFIEAGVLAMRSAPAASYGRLALWAFGALAAELVIGFPFAFSPGWANGWPCGLTIHRVWSAGMTAYLFVLMITVGMGAGATITSLLRLLPPVRRRSESFFRAWLMLWTALTAVACTMAYRDAYASTLEMWPDGYPIHMP
jgi:hypothetical protein